MVSWKNERAVSALLKQPICYLQSSQLFQHGHYEIRAYNGSLHAGEVRSQIVLALAISNAAMTKKYCSPHVSQSDNMRYSFRVWLLNLGLIGDEFKIAEHIC